MEAFVTEDCVQDSVFNLCIAAGGGFYAVRDFLGIDGFQVRVVQDDMLFYLIVLKLAQIAA